MTDRHRDRTPDPLLWLLAFLAGWALAMWLAAPAAGQFELCSATVADGTEAGTDTIAVCDESAAAPIAITIDQILARASASGDLTGSYPGPLTIAADAVALGTDTTGGYAGSTTEGGGATALEASALDDIGEIHTSVRSGLDSVLVTGTAGAGGICAEWNADGDLVAAVSAAACSAGGGSMVLDLGDDAADESTALAEIATTGDTYGVATEPTADKLLLDMSKPWPMAVALDTDNDGVGEVLQSGSELVLLNGVHGWRIAVSGYFYPAGVNGAVLVREDSTSTVPGLVAHKGDFDTGIGWNTFDDMSLIAGAVSVVSVSHDGSRALTTITDLLRLHNAATPPAACAAGIAGSLYHDTTTPEICWCDGTAWQPVVGAGDCT